MTMPAPSRLSVSWLSAFAACALALPSAAADAPASAPPLSATATPALSDVPATATASTPAGGKAPEVEESPETAIIVPPPVPTGILVAWKPTLLSVRVDNGQGNQQFGSDKFQPLRGLARYTFLFDPTRPFVGRIEVEGGQFKSDTQNVYVGSVGTDFTARAMVGAATRITPGFTILASLGAITRYQYGRPSGGAPTIGVLGLASNMELEYRVFPNITLSAFAEAALAPIPYASEKDLGELSDASEFRGRLQVSFDLFRDVALDVGYDFTRWHTSFAGSTILGNPLPNQALLIEDRENGLTLGVRWKM